MIVNIPIEPIPMRYSVDWNTWFINYFEKNKVDYDTVIGKELTKGIEQGKFLDCIGTNFYKSSQLMDILEGIHVGFITNGDVLFFHDLWFPGIEQIKYTCQALGLDIKIMGCLHAGAYDPNDFLYQKKMGSWAIHFEHMLFSLVDEIFVATNYHKELIMKSRSLDSNKIKVTGFPFISRKTKVIPKRNQIVFPHRKDPEKNYDEFIDLKTAASCTDDLRDWRWVTTAELTSKEEYYRVLEESTIALSLADQETWGIAMQECTIAGCIPLVPDRLSYSEMFLSPFKYSTILNVLDFIRLIIGTLDIYEAQRKVQAVIFENLGEKAFTNITQRLTK